MLLFSALSQLLTLAKRFPLLLPLLLDWLPCPQPCQSRTWLCHPCRQHSQSSASTSHLGGAMDRLLHLFRTSPEAATSPESVCSLRGVEPLQPSVPLPLARAHHQPYDRFLQRSRGWRDINSCYRRVVPAPWPQLAAPCWPVSAIIGGSVILPAIHWSLGGSSGCVPEGENRWQPPGAADWGHSVTWLPPEPPPCHQDHTVHTGLEAQDLITHSHAHNPENVPVEYWALLNVPSTVTNWLLSPTDSH